MAAGVVLEVQEILYYPLYSEPEPPLGSRDFAMRVQVLIGEAGEDLADAFDVFVCSPNRLAQLYDLDRWDEDEVLPGGNIMPITGLWLMRSWSPDELEAAVRRVVASYSPGPDFQTVASRIGRLMPWEYDYRHDAQTNQAAGISKPIGHLWHEEEPDDCR